MSGIMQRKALVDLSRGKFEVLDYSLVDTSLGTMIEVGNPFVSIRGGNLWRDREDQFQRVDGFIPFNQDKISQLFREV